MDAGTIIQLVSTLGFPVVMCGALFWYIVNQNAKHDNEVKALTTTLENNTKVLTELSTLIKTLVK